MKTSQRIALFLMLVMTSGSGLVAAGDELPTWESDYARVRKNAKSKDLPIMLSIGSENCSWCKKLHVTTFQNRKIAATLASEFVTGKMDAEQNQSLVQALKLEAYPTLVFAAPDGTILQMTQGFQTTEEFEATLLQTQKLLQAHRRKITLTNHTMPR